jgi:hypothetical protein
VVGDNEDHAAAAALLERAMQLVDQTGERWCEAEILRLKAHFSAKDAEEESASLRASIAKAREQGAKLWELRAARDLAELLDDDGNREAAGQLLGPIYGCFRDELETPDLVDARALLARLGNAANSQPLTRRDTAPTQRAGSA